MNQDDITYLCLLIFSISFGYYYKQINDKTLKKNVGTIIGFLIVFIVSGFHIIHPLIATLVNAFIILYTDKRKCHLVSFVFTFLYLFFFRTTAYFGIPYAPAHTNLVQMILTVKLVGLAFEVNSTYTSKKAEKISNDEEVACFVEPNFVDIFHYAFNYIGVLTGPYYRYRTFIDYFEYPFSAYADWKTATIKKLKWVPFYAALFYWGSYNWPVTYATTDEFFNERSWIYRQWFIWPNFFIFRMRIYIGMVLSECVCTMAGFGAYPTFSNPKPGQGPSSNFDEMKKLPFSKKAETEMYNFKTILNINPYGADFCTTYRQGMKHWNITIQYWLAANVYKRFPSKKFRTMATVVVSAFWHGVYSGYYICICTVPFVLILEDVYVKLHEHHKVAQWIHWILKMHFFGYQAIAFLLLDVNKIMHYYNSIYHATLIFGIILYVVGMFLLKQKQGKLKILKESEQAKNNPQQITN